MNLWELLSGLNIKIIKFTGSIREYLSWVLVFLGVISSSQQLIEPGIAPKFFLGYLGVLLLPTSKVFYGRKEIKIALLLIALLLLVLFIQLLFLDKIVWILALSRAFSILFLPIAFFKIKSWYSEDKSVVIFRGFNITLICILLYAYYHVVFVLGDLTGSTSYGLNSFFDHRNILGAFVLLALIITTYFALYKKEIVEGVHKYFYYFNLVFGLALVVNLHSLASLLIASLFFISIVILGIVLKNNRVLVPAVIAALLGGGYFAMVGMEDNGHSNNSVEISVGNSNEDRIVFWEKSVNMIKRAPLVGVGSGNWMIYAGEGGWAGTQCSDGVTFVTRPHNDWLWISSEYGIITGLTYIIFFLFFVFILIRRMISSFQWSDIVLSVGMMAVFLYSSVSFPSERYSLLICFAILFIIISPNSKEKQESYSINFGANILVIAALIAFALQGRADYLSLKITDAKQKDELALVEEEINSMEGLGMKYDRLGVPMSWYRGTIWLRKGDYIQAKEEFLRAIQLAPYLSIAHSDLGVSQMMDKDSNVIRSFLNAIELSPDFQEARLNLASCYFLNNQMDSAINQLQFVVDKNYLENKNELLKLIDSKH